MVRKPKEPVDPTEVGPTEVAINSWDRTERILRLLQPVMIAVLTLVTLWVGKNAAEAANQAQKTAQIAQVADSVRAHILHEIETVQDTIHKIVNNERSELKKENRELEKHNVELTTQLRARGIRPAKREVEPDVKPDPNNP